MLRCSRLLTVLAGIGAALCLFAAPSQAADGATFTLKPVTVDAAQPASQAYFIFAAQPGTTVQNQVQVGNSGATAGTVKLYAVDATTGQNSGTVFQTNQDPRQDVGAWTTLGTSELTLQPGETQDIPVSVAIPAGARPGQHVGGIVAENTALTQGTGGGSISVNVQNLRIVAVQVNLPGPVVEQVDATGIATTGSAGSQSLVLSLHNSGTTLLKPVGTLVVTDAWGQQLQNLPLTLDTFLPQTAIQYPVLVEKTALGVGAYQATLDLTYGSAGHTHVSLPFTISAAQAAQVFQPRAPLAAPAPASAPTKTAASPQTTSWLLWSGVIALALCGGVALILRRKRGART
jgi:hypothetical protein